MVAQLICIQQVGIRFPIGPPVIRAGFSNDIFVYKLPVLCSLHSFHNKYQFENDSLDKEISNLRENCCQSFRLYGRCAMLYSFHSNSIGCRYYIYIHHCSPLNNVSMSMGDEPFRPLYEVWLWFYIDSPIDICYYNICRSVETA
jgi:hypothetical protein